MNPTHNGSVRGSRIHAIGAGLAVLLVVVPSRGYSAAHAPGSGPLTLACRPYGCVVDRWILGPLTLPASVGHGITPLSYAAVTGGTRARGGSAIAETVRVTNRGHTTSPVTGETIVGPIDEVWNVSLQTPVRTFSTSISANTGLYSPPMAVVFSDVPVLPQKEYSADSIRFWSHEGRLTHNGRRLKLHVDSAEHYIYFFHLARPAAPH